MKSTKANANFFVTIASRQPNSGKTTIALSLAEIMAERGHRVCLIDLDGENSGGTGTASTLVGRRQGARNFKLHRIEQDADETGLKECELMIVDTSRMPSPDVMSAITMDSEIVLIPATIDPKSISEAAALYRQLSKDNCRAIIVPNLSGGGSHKEIAEKFLTLDPEISPAIPRSDQAAKVLADGLPLSYCETGDAAAVDDFKRSIGELAKIISRAITGEPSRATASA